MHQKIAYSSKPVLSAELEEKLSADIVQIHFGGWEQHNFDQVASKCEKWTLSHLQFYENNNSQIYKNIRHISFPELRILALGANQIQSFQGISQIYMPSLKNFSFGNNFIRSIKCFRKCFLPFLTQIQLKENPTNDCESLVDLFMGDKFEISLEWHASAEVSPTITWLAKIETKKAGWLEIRTHFRIIRKEFEDVLRKRHPTGRVLVRK